MNIDQLIASVRAAMAPKLAERKTLKDKIDAVRTACAAESRDPSDDEAREVTDAAEKIRGLDAELEAQAARVTELEDEKRRDAAADRLSREVHPVATASTTARGYENQTRIGTEERTYRPDTDKRGTMFASDVVASLLGDFDARERITRHSQEERVLRGQDQFDVRAVGTGAFSGIVVPQYLVDAFAGKPRADRPLADAMRSHDLPEVGMTVNLGKLTTGTTAAEQTSENSAVSETNADDTLLTANVLTSAGSQTVSRQGSERGVGVEDTIIEDLISAQRSNLDSIILNKATVGLSAVATSIAYTDASPTAAELYPKLLAGPAAVEAAMLNAHPGDVIAVMHSRRWYWLQSQLTSTWPLFGQPGVATQTAGQDYGERYGNGFRGILPSGTPVIVDNNISTAFGTNEDEIYFVSQTESHLWEDANAPTLIRAEQAKTLGIDLVIYAYFAFMFDRVSHAQKISGTGLILPTF